MTPLLDLLRRAGAWIGKVLIGIALVCLPACGNDGLTRDDLEQELVRRAHACRASCGAAGMCIERFVPWDESWGTMKTCECGVCAGLIGGP